MPEPESGAVDAEFETLVQGFAFAEAPRVGDDGTIYFSDLTGGGYYARAPDGTVRTVLPDRLWIGGATLDQGNAIVCSGKGGLVLVDAQTGASRNLLSAFNGRAIVAVNDIEADARGNLFGGTIDFAAVFERGEVPRGGVFFRLDPSGTVHVLRDDVVASNGIGFSLDGTILYHSESTIGIWAWRMGDDGLPHDRVLFAAVEDCDGLAVDIEGGIWVACWQSAEIRRYRADGLLERLIALPFPSVTSLAFGGPDMRDLHVATGGNETFPDKGGIVRIRTDVPGLRPFRSRFGPA